MNGAFTISYCFVSLAALAFIYFVLAASLRREMFRCRIRLIRNNLFDFMWQNGHDFNDPAYRKARNDLNIILAASNKLSLTLLAVLTYAAVAAWRRTGAQPIQEAADPKVAEQIRGAYVAAIWTLIEYSLFKGIPGVFFIGTLFVLNHALRFNNRLRTVKEGVIEDGANFLQAAGPEAALPANLFHESSPRRPMFALSGRP